MGFIKKVLIFDLDGTLYPSSGGILQKMHSNVTKVVEKVIEKKGKKEFHEHFKGKINNCKGEEDDYKKYTPKDYANYLYAKYGSTIRGLIDLNLWDWKYFENIEKENNKKDKNGGDDIYLGLDFDEETEEEKEHIKILIQYFNFIHSFDFKKDTTLIQNDPKIQKLFKKLKETYTLQNDSLIILFTAADRLHSSKVLNYYGISNFFNLKICFEDLKLKRKPTPESFIKSEQLIQQYLNNNFNEKYKISKDKTKFIFFEDSLNNIKGAIKHGWDCVWINEDKKKESDSIVIDKSKVHIFDSIHKVKIKELDLDFQL